MLFIGEEANYIIILPLQRYMVDPSSGTLRTISEATCITQPKYDSPTRDKNSNLSKVDGWEDRGVDAIFTQFFFYPDLKPEGKRKTVMRKLCTFFLIFFNNDETPYPL